jgi:hypothetical protein
LIILITPFIYLFIFVLPCRDPSCTGGDAENYQSLVQALTTQVLLCLHGRDDKNLQVKYGETVLNLLTFDEVLEIFKEKHHL